MRQRQPSRIWSSDRAIQEKGGRAAQARPGTPSDSDDGRVPRSPRCEQARVAHQKSCPIGELLARPEDQHLEFKSTLRWDLKEGEKSKLVESAVIKTVAGFLNSRFGGTLLIGVGDGRMRSGWSTIRDGDSERKGLADSQLHLGQLIENAVALAAAANVTFATHHVDGHDLCRVYVEPSAHPVRRGHGGGAGGSGKKRLPATTTERARSGTSRSAALYRAALGVGNGPASSEGTGFRLLIGFLGEVERTTPARPQLDALRRRRRSGATRT